MDYGDYYWGTYGDYYRDPFPHSLLRTSQTTTATTTTTTTTSNTNSNNDAYTSTVMHH